MDKTTKQPLRVVFLTEGEAPPEAVVKLLEHDSMVVGGRELDAFFAELEMGFPIPDLLVGVGGQSLVQTLRRHEQTACLPIFRWGSTATTPPGWDGSVVRWSEARLSDVALWLERLTPFPRVAEAEESDRREHLFLRYLATRGTASLAAAKEFGVKAPHAALRRWTERGWCHGSIQHLKATPGLLEVVGRERLHIEELLTHPGQEVVVHKKSIASKNPNVNPSVLPVERRGGSKLAWMTIAVLLVLVAFLFQKAGGVGWMRNLFASELPDLESAMEDPVAESEPPPLEVALSKEQMPSLPELYLDARLMRPLLEITANLDGRLQWSAEEKSSVMAGAQVGMITQVAGVDRSDRLNVLMQDMAAELALQQAAAALAWKSGLEDAQEVARMKTAALVTLERRLPSLQQTYAQSKSLAEEGVISFREVRPDWDALLALEEDIAQAKQVQDTAEGVVAKLQKEGAPDLAQQASWTTQTKALQVQLEEAKATQIQVPILVEQPGDFEPLLAAGEVCHAGQVIALLSPQNGGYLEAVLATPDWNAAYLVGGARLRRPERSSWMPTRILSASSEPDGLTRLRLRLPVGWLDDALALADADHQLLELRLTAPVPTSPDSPPEASQPNGKLSVEQPR
ncbi:MAG: hypothetical protein O3A95_04505 [Planctomycetota bacterium]|nr:hypothetical protein [Planctomycetota bacterium]